MSEGCNYGYGRYKWEDGSTYEGQSYKDYKHGFGIENSPGYIYCGTYANGNKDGFGYIYKDNSLHFVRMQKGNIISSERLGFAANNEDPVYELIEQSYKKLLATGDFTEGDADDLDDDEFADKHSLSDAKKIEEVIDGESVEKSEEK